MAQTVELQVEPRTLLGKATRHLRQADIIPANIYGHKKPSIAVQIEAIPFDRVRREHARSVLSLRLPNGVTETVLIRSVQRDPRTTFILHVDFERVSLSERLTMKLPLHFVGEASGVKMHGGLLLPLLEALEVECRASDIIGSLDVDVSGLTEIDSALHAGDIKLPGGYKLLTDAEEPVVKIQAPRVEAAEEAAPAAAAEQAAPAAEGAPASSEE